MERNLMIAKEEEDYRNKLCRNCNHYINDDIRSEWLDSVGNCNINYEQCHGNDKCHHLNFKSEK